MALVSLTDDLAATARRRYREICRATPNNLDAWSKVASELNLAIVPLLRRCAPELAAFLKTPTSSLPPRRGRIPRHTAQQVIDLHRQHPDWTSLELAKALGCLSGYVRATAQRQGLSLPVRKKVVQPPRAPRIKKVAAVEELSEREKLVEIFFEVFDTMFVDRAVFDPEPSLYEQWCDARRRGQSITGFLMGDPLPSRALQK